MRRARSADQAEGGGGTGAARLEAASGGKAESGGKSWDGEGGVDWSGGEDRNSSEATRFASWPLLRTERESFWASVLVMLMRVGMSPMVPEKTAQPRKQHCFCVLRELHEPKLQR